jgi:6-pyruvoyltetrahydropterin/6-carboxytetrahydropterin synthase
MYKIKVELGFSSAHNLRGYKGKCEELHGHNWKVEVGVASKNLDKIGMVTDFAYLKDKLKRVLGAMDHKYLNKIPYFKKVNPTSENIAKYIYDKLSFSLSKDNLKGVKILEVTVWESDKARATYYEG